MKSIIAITSAILTTLSTLTSAAPTSTPDPAGLPLEKRYINGWCTMHITQHQRAEPDNPGPNYTLNVHVFSADGANQGVDTASPANGQGMYITRDALQWGLTVAVGNVDQDPLRFYYGGWVGESSSACRVGKYDNGKREMDCGWTC